MHCAKRCGLFILASLLFMAVVAAIGLNLAADWLSVADKPEKADAILVLGGDFSRPFQAADLYRQGLAPKVLVSVPVRVSSSRMLDDLGVPFPRDEEIYREILLKRGVPPAAIEYFGKDSISTAAEAQVARAIFSNGSPRLLIVTSPYHLRRTRMVFADALPHADIRVIPTGYETLAKQWWKEQDSARNVLLELPKIVFYKLGGRF